MGYFAGGLLDEGKSFGFVFTITLPLRVAVGNYLDFGLCFEALTGVALVQVVPFEHGLNLTVIIDNHWGTFG